MKHSTLSASATANQLPADATTRSPAKHIYRRMNGPLRRVASDLAATFAANGDGHLPTLCRAGVQHMWAVADPAKFGERAGDELAAYLGIAPMVLMAAREVAFAFSDTDIERLAHERDSAGRPPSLAHLAVLAYVESAAERNSLLARALTASVTAGELCAWAAEVPGDHAMQRRVVAALTRSTDAAGENSAADGRKACSRPDAPSRGGRPLPRLRSKAARAAGSTARGGRSASEALLIGVETWALPVEEVAGRG